MGIEIKSSHIICSKCGKAYNTRRTYFSAHYGDLYKGIGFLSICKECVERLYNTYFLQCNDMGLAVRQVCRKLDLYWSQKIFESVERKNTSRTIMTGYIAKLNSAKNAGKCYDTTLAEAGLLWAFDQKQEEPKEEESKQDESQETDSVISKRLNDIDFEVTDEMIDFWGDSYEDDITYYKLEKRKAYWMSTIPDKNNQLSAEGIIRQICPLELDIDKRRDRGQDVDKFISSFDKLTAKLKPLQRDSDSDLDMVDTPLGVWLYRYEKKKPLPEVDDDLKDVNGILKYVFIWLGHVCKMLGKKNGFARLYESEIQRLRVENPEYAEEDDEEMMMDIFDDAGIEDGG